MFAIAKCNKQATVVGLLMTTLATGVVIKCC